MSRRIWDCYPGIKYDILMTDFVTSKLRLKWSKELTDSQTTSTIENYNYIIKEDRIS